MSAKEPSSPEPASSQGSGILPLKAEKYLEYVEDCELSEPQKLEFLRTLWHIMSAFVRMGFDVDSTLPNVFQKASKNAENTLEATIPSHEFNVAADDEAGAKEE